MPRASRVVASVLALVPLAACGRARGTRDASVARSGPATARRALVSNDAVADASAPPVLAGETGSGAARDPAVGGWNAPPEAPVASRFGAVFDLVPDGAGGALLVWAEPDPEAPRSDVLALRVDADGRALGTPRRLRRTAGEVRAIAASTRGDTAWVAWVAAVGPQTPFADGVTRAGTVLGERLVAALTVRADLSAVTPPVTVRDELVRAAPRMFPGEFVEVLSLADGGAAVLAPAETARCTRELDNGRTTREWCAGFGVHVLAPTGQLARSAVEQTLTPVAVPRALVRLEPGAGREALAYVRTDDERYTHTLVYAVDPAGAGASVLPAAMTEPLAFWSRATLAWTGRELLAVGFQEGEDLVADERAVRVVRGGARAESVPADAAPRPVPIGITQHIHLQDSDDGWPWLLAHEIHCAAPARLVVRLRWRGGGMLEFDPLAPGTSLRLSDWIPPRALPGAPAVPDGVREPPLVWTARGVLVGVNAPHGEFRRWRCGPAGSFVPAP